MAIVGNVSNNTKNWIQHTITYSGFGNTLPLHMESQKLFLRPCKISGTLVEYPEYLVGREKCSENLNIPIYPSIMHRLTRRGPDTLFRDFRHAITTGWVKEQGYFGGKGIIFDLQMNPLLLMTRVEELKTRKHIKEILYVNQFVFVDQTLPLNKYIIQHIIPYMLTNTCTCKDWSSYNATHTVHVELDFSNRINDFITKPEIPKNLSVKQIELMLNQKIKDNVNKILL